MLAFAVCTHDRGVPKLTAQLYPLMPDEAKTVSLEFDQSGRWEQVAQAEVQTLGWSAHFRIEDWDITQNVRYRVRHGKDATFEGLIRRDPIDKDVIVIGALSCNSSRTPGPRPKIIKNLKIQNPDLLFFADDQSYHHTQHTLGWLEFGLQFREILKDRPSICIPDDHDLGQGNIWGENGRKAAQPAGDDGGFFYPAKFVNMVQRCQTGHLPDAFDPTPIERGIDFTNLEDRKFKSRPRGKIPQMGPRADHINDRAMTETRSMCPVQPCLGTVKSAFCKPEGRTGKAPS